MPNTESMRPQMVDTIYYGGKAEAIEPNLANSYTEYVRRNIIGNKNYQSQIRELDGITDEIAQNIIPFFNKNTETGKVWITFPLGGRVHTIKLTNAELKKAVKGLFSGSNDEIVQSLSKTSQDISEKRPSQDKMVILTTSDSYVLSDLEIKDFIDHVLKAIYPAKKIKISIFLNTQISKKGIKTTFNLQKLYGDDNIQEDLNIEALGEKIKLKFKIGPNSFFQPNTDMAANLYSTAINYLNKEEIKDKTALDLYSGTGTIGMILSKFVKKVIAIELSENACKMAEDNMKLNNIKNFEMINGDVSKILNILLNDKNFEKPEIIIVDPPRAGLGDEAIENILKISPDTIIYISCNINTQLEDIKILTNLDLTNPDWKNPKYQLKTLHPIDQFPHTFHLENIAILKKLDFD